jgi:hypothetical protein
MKKKFRTALIVLTPLLAWRPWYTPQPYVPLNPWVHITYSDEEQLLAQQQADSAKHPEFLDPKRTLRSFLGTEIMQNNPTTPFGMGEVLSIEDYGTDLRTGDRMFRVTVSTENTVLRFRLRQLLGRGPGKAWFVIGYLPDPSGAGYGSLTSPSADGN